MNNRTIEETTQLILQPFRYKRIAFKDLDEVIKREVKEDPNLKRDVYVDVIRKSLGRIIISDASDVATLLFNVAHDNEVVEAILRQSKIKEFIRADSSFRILSKLAELSEDTTETDKVRYAIIKSVMRLYDPVRLATHVPSKYEAKFIQDYEAVTGMDLTLEQLIEINEHRYLNSHAFIMQNKNLHWLKVEELLRKSAEEKQDVNIMLANDGIPEMIKSDEKQRSLFEWSRLWNDGKVENKKSGVTPVENKNIEEPKKDPAHIGEKIKSLTTRLEEYMKHADGNPKNFKIFTERKSKNQLINHDIAETIKNELWAERSDNKSEIEVIEEVLRKYQYTMRNFRMYLRTEHNGEMHSIRSDTLTSIIDDGKGWVEQHHKSNKKF